MEKIKKSSSTLLKVISVILAVILWAYVAYQENPDMTNWVKNVPITIVGTGELDEAGFRLMGTDRSTIDVKLKGDRLSLAKVKTEDITVKLDVSKIFRAGEASVTCDISVDKKNVDVSDSRHSTIVVTTEKITTDVFPVSTNIVGSPAKGYSVFDPVTSCSEVTVRGAESVISSIASVSTKSVSVSGINSSGSVSTDLTAFDADGKAVSGITFDPATIEVSYTVLKEKTVLLKAVLDNAPAGTSFEWAPSSVKIYGSAEALAAVGEVYTQHIDASALKGGDKKSVRLELPSGTRLASETSTAKLTFTAVSEADSNEQ